MSVKTFMSYRRADHPDFTKRVEDRFVAHFGRENVFMDYDSIRPGTDWQAEIKQAVLDTDALIVIIGSKWLEILKGKASDGLDDYVIFEIDLALKHNKRIFPVCIQGESTPPYDTDLPENIRAMMNSNALTIDPNRNFDNDCRYLIDTIEEQLGKKASPSRKASPACPTAPRPPAHFVGRVKEIDKLFTNLGDGQTVAITAVKGIGGMGKTTLAQALCHHEKSPFKAVFWADITPNPEASSHLQGWARYADPNYTLPAELTPAQLAQEADRISTLLTAHADTHCGTTLVVFDDVWENGVETVKLLRRAMPKNAQVLMTTRSDKVVNLLNAQKGKVSLDELPDEDAEKLLRELTDGNTHVTDAQLQRTVDLLQGHPLALEIAAESLNIALDAHDIDEILDDYDTGIKQGTAFDAMDLDAELPRSLNAVFERTYKHFDDTQQRCFRAFGILAPESVFNRELLTSLWELEDSKDVSKLMRDFNGRALIKPDADSTATYNDTYYTQHALLRTYARALLLQAGDELIIYIRYLAYAINEADQFYTLPLEHWSQLDPFLPHLHEVGDKLVGLYEANNDDETINQAALEFARNIKDYLFRRPENLFVDGGLTRHTWLEIGLQASEALGDKLRQGLFNNQLAILYSAIGDKRKALDYYQRALPIFKQVGNKSSEATTLNNIGMVYQSLGDMTKALDYFQRALPIRQQVGDLSGEATTLNNIGGVYQSLGDMTKALDYFQRALPIRQQVGDLSGEATTLNNIGIVYDALGDKPKALDYYQRALPIRQQVGDLSGEATTLNNIGMVYQSLGDMTKALDYYLQVLPILQQIGDRYHEAMSCFNIGMIYANQGNLEEAIRYVERTVALDEQVQHPDLESDRQTLMQLKQMAGQTPSQDDQQAQALQMLLEMYAEQGESAVRKVLSEQGVPSEAIDQLMGELEQAQAQQRIIDTYKTEGEEAVKALLKEWGNDDDAIEGVLAELRQME